MLQQIQVLLAEAEEAIQRLNSVKFRIDDELACQVAKAPGKTMGAKKGEVLFGLVQEERRASTYLEQFYQEKIFWEPKKTTPKKNAPATDGEVKESKDEALVLTTKRPGVMTRSQPQS